jgi:4-amino-4-deoxy-L-arabinose transferase-like glycosyltransferase
VVEPPHTNSARDLWGDPLFGACAVVLLFWALGECSLWAAEDRWAEITREMLLNGDFFHPTINGETYFDKPLLTYWLIALVSLVTGQLNEWEVRLPSAISGLIVLLATIHLGRRLWSPAVGRTAGWLLLTSYAFLFWARTGMADMENLAAVMLALAWYWERREQPNFLTFLVFYVTGFIGSLTKGLTAVVIPVLVLLPEFLAGKRWKSLVKPAHFLALAMAGALYLTPFVYASMTGLDFRADGLNLVFQENIQRYFQPFDHKEPFYVYFYYVPMLFLPWTPLLVAACGGRLAQWKVMETGERWLIKAMALIFLFFTASGSRRSYYILPILPFCALWTAVFLTSATSDASLQRWKQHGTRVIQFTFLLLIGIGLASPVLWSLLAQRLQFVATASLRTATLVLSLAALGVAVFDFWRPGRLARATGTGQDIAVLIAVAAVLMGGYFGVIQNSLEAYRTARRFAQEFKALAGDVAPEQIGFYRKASASVLFYLALPQPVAVMKDAEALQGFIESESSGKLIIGKGRDFSSLMSSLQVQAAKREILAETAYPWEGMSSQKLSAWAFHLPKE